MIWSVSEDKKEPTSKSNMEKSYYVEKRKGQDLLNLEKPPLLKT